MLLLLTQLSPAAASSLAVTSAGLERLAALAVAAPSGDGNRLTGMATELQQLAAKIINGKEHMTELHKEVFDRMREDMKTVNTTIASDHREDQAEVDRALQAILDCAPNQTKFDSAAKYASEAESAHEECRLQELKFASLVKGACGGTDMFEEMDPPCIKGPPADAWPEELRGYLDALREQIQKARKWNATISLQNAECENAEQQYFEKIAECNVSQAHFEMGSCAYRQTVADGCAAFEACRAKHIAEQSEIQEAVGVSEAGRKAGYKAVRQIICLVEVFEVSPEEQPARYDACTHLSLDTSHLDINYHKAPPGDCDTTPVDQYPCLGDWIGAHYKSKDWYERSQIADCVPCAIVKG